MSGINKELNKIRKFLGNPNGITLDTNLQEHKETIKDQDIGDISC